MARNTSEAKKTKEAKAPTIKCPDCGETDASLIRHQEMTPTMCGIEIVNGELHVEAASYEHCHEESKDHCLFCSQCGTEFPIPKGMKVEWV